MSWRPRSRVCRPRRGASANREAINAMRRSATLIAAVVATGLSLGPGPRGEAQSPLRIGASLAQTGPSALAALPMAGRQEGDRVAPGAGAREAGLPDAAVPLSEVGKVFADHIREALRCAHGEL